MEYVLIAGTLGGVWWKLGLRRVNDRMTTIKLVVDGFNLKVSSAYTPQMGLDEEAKKLFWEDLDEVVRGVMNTKKIFIGGDFKGHIDATSSGLNDVHGGYGFGERNEGRASLLDFATDFQLVIAISYFLKRENHLFTYCNTVVKTQIDYDFLKKGDRGFRKDCNYSE